VKNRLAACAVLLLAVTGFAGAEEQPQIAYRILTGYIDKKASESLSGRKGAGIGLSIGGGLVLASGAVTYLWGDSIARAAGGPALDPTVKTSVSIGLGVGGLALLSIGGSLAAARPKDYRSEYGEVFEERDPLVREALAVAVLRDLAIKGEKKRVSGAVMNLLFPVIYGAIQAGANLSQGKVWHDQVLNGLYWTAWNVASGVSELFGSSEEERLYEKYRAGREALFGNGSSRP
jgi:hypothetical protein